MTIGELAKAADVPISTVRYYEREGILKASRRSASNYRLYSEEDAQRIKILADAKAYEIATINKAASGNPAYIQLQSLEALKKMSEDPAAKLYFLDSNSPQPLPLMNIGDPVIGKR